MYENPDAEFFGRKWPMVLRGICPSCGLQHITVPDSLKPEWDRARIEYETELIRREEEQVRQMDGRYYGAVGAIRLCADEDRFRCIAKLMARAWHDHPQGFWVTRYGRPELDWTYREAETEGWFDYHLHVTMSRPINGHDDTEHYDEEFCCQSLDQVRELLRGGGRVVSWELWHRGTDHWKIGGGHLTTDRLERILGVFA